MAAIALITGASSGLGVALANELAGRKYDLVITARRLQLLEQVAHGIRQQFGVRVTAIRSDLSTAEGAKQLFHEVRQRDLPIDLLVNNAGFGRFGPLLDQSPTELLDMIQVNLAALTTLTRRFAAVMQECGGGYILNIASFSAILPSPRYAVYSGTKAYVLAFSQALHHELRASNIRVCALCPGFFDSDFLETAGQPPSRLVRLIMLRREQVARAGIAGVLRGKAVVVPGLFYKLSNIMLRLAPRTTASAIADFVVKV